MSAYEIESVHIALWAARSRVVTKKGRAAGRKKFNVAQVLDALAAAEQSEREELERLTLSAATRPR